eukprot:augustus_masked-scaffold_15-processed-gene-4.9-mRNA-1 protein AED:1.00 eAED:1.00 QI:0/-1/0/0/-1/1/1/0/453
MNEAIEELLVAYNHIRTTLETVHISDSLQDQIDALTLPFFADPTSVATLTDTLNEIGDFSDNLLTPLLEQYVGSRTAQKVQFAIDDLLTALEKYRDHQIKNLRKQNANGVSQYSLEKLNEKPHEYKSLLKSCPASNSSVLIPAPFELDIALGDLNTSLPTLAEVNNARNQSRYTRNVDLAILINRQKGGDLTNSFSESIIPKISLSPGQCLVELESFHIARNITQKHKDVGPQVFFRGLVKAIGWKKGDSVHLMHISREDTVLGVSLLGEIYSTSDKHSEYFLGEYLVCDLNNLARVPRGYPNLYANDLVQVCYILATLPKKNLRQTFSFIGSPTTNQVNVQVNNTIMKEIVEGLTQNVNVTVNGQLNDDNYLDLGIYYKEVLIFMGKKLNALKRDTKRKIIEEIKSYYSARPFKSFEEGDIFAGDVVKLTRGSIKELKERVRASAAALIASS